MKLGVRTETGDTESAEIATQEIPEITETDLEELKIKVEAITSQVPHKFSAVKVNGKSIMELLTLAAAQGCFITIRADGKDETAAIVALRQLIDQKFG